VATAIVLQLPPLLLLSAPLLYTCNKNLISSSASKTRPTAPRLQKSQRKSKPLPNLDSLAGVLKEVAAGAGAAAGSERAKQKAGKGRSSSVKRLKARQAIA
jgi:hypothetical protein